jgi:pyruvate/2-oxoglutarate/acetoin dehydrogenase E1 component/TPP-dependent pyruvate/acetoin dehydrogenase alpha subunit
MDMKPVPSPLIKESTTLTLSEADILADYQLAYRSRQASLIGRREVLTGKAKFGIFGDGKELPQVAMARVCQPGDIRSGYYRDQTFALATGLVTIKQFFAQLYADPDPTHDPHSAGRQMNAHFASRFLNDQGEWTRLTDKPHSAADASPTASQMPRLVGLAQASKLYRQLPELHSFTQFSQQGNEVAFGTIGNASCAEGHFWETLNAIGVIQAPLIMSIWDDDYGISVPNEFQITKHSLADMLAGFQRNDEERGFEIFRVKAWDYEGLIRTYQAAEHLARSAHVPSIIHVTEATQPQGHSTSGSHERYKSKERLAWEKDHDCLTRMRDYLIERGIIGDKELEAFEKEARKEIRQIKNEAWKELQDPIKDKLAELLAMASQIATKSARKETLQDITNELKSSLEPKRREMMTAAHQILLTVREETHPAIDKLRSWWREENRVNQAAYDSHLYSESVHSPMQVEGIEPIYPEQPELVSGHEILNRAFDDILTRDPRVIAFGEDVGYLGDVNQGFAGLQKKHGTLRVSDTGIREATIMGQAIGLAMRGLRPIAEIQYLDYFIYGLQILSDDLASLHYRSKGGQKAPAIIRTRGHRLEGIWHAGSPMGMMIHALRGIHLAVPRDMTQAIRFYHTFLQGDDPAIVVEVLNGYRLKEPVPSNLHEITLPLGVPEILRPGTDLTLVTYGACCRLALQAAEQLSDCDIEVEVIDVQTLLPFDRPGLISASLQKTNRVLFLDEDVPGGATSYMMQQVLERQGGYFHLDSPPATLTASAHRTAFGDDGDYWSKPQVETIFRKVYELMSEADPAHYPRFY